jgi:hypothetical protein
MGTSPDLTHHDDPHDHDRHLLLVLRLLEASARLFDQRRILMLDKLRSHLTNQVYMTVHIRPTPNRFEIVPRPPHMPKYGPTEYAFTELGFRLPEQLGFWRPTTINLILGTTIGRNGSFDALCEHFGY